MLKQDLNHYVNKFRNLRVNRSKKLGTAPHKPIILLAILELIDQGKISHNQIQLTPELIATFLKYWGHLVTTGHKPTIALPFYHLTGDKFWHLQPNPYSGTLKINPSIKTLQEIYAYAHFDPELFNLLQDSQTRQILLQTILETYFQTNLADIQSLYQTNAFDSQMRVLETNNTIYSIEQLNQETEEQQIVRSGAFRSRITQAYDHHCALCHLKIISNTGQTIIDGAHIKPFAKFRDDRLSNGLSLCKNHHWAFDRGWFGIDRDYRLIVPNDRIHEEPPIGTKTLQDHHGEIILLPSQPQFHPDPEALDWHREFWSVR